MWYEADLVDEDDIKEWHSSPTTQGIDVEPEDYGSDLNKLWVIGGRLLAHLESDDESEEDSEEDSESDEDEDDDKVAPSKPTAHAVHATKTAVPPSALKAGPSKQTEESEEEESEEDESEEEDGQPVNQVPPASKTTAAVKPQATPRTTAPLKQEAGEGEGKGETEDEEETPAPDPQSTQAGAPQNRPIKPMPPSVLAKPSIANPVAMQKHQAVETSKASAAPTTESDDEEDEEDDEEDDEE